MTRLERLHAAVEQARPLLPAQGPIGVFVHHNTLHAFEDLPFERAVIEAGGVFGAEPFAAEAEYRSAYARGRILERDLEAVLRDELEPERRALAQRALLVIDEEPSDAALDWRASEGQLDSALLEACVARFAVPSPRAEPARPDTSRLIHPTLIRLVAAFVDQGVAYWAMPGREAGLFAAARALLAQPAPPPNPWVHRVTRAMRGAEGAPAELAVQALDALGVAEADWGDFVREQLLALRGWAGLVNQLELRPDRVPARRVPASLVDFLALRLVLEREARGFLGERATRPASPRTDGRDLRVAEAAYGVFAGEGGGLAALEALDADAVSALARELAALDSTERRRLWHLAYERRHAQEFLGALAAHRPRPAPRPRFQAVFCIDERAESLRRHLEEILPAVETYAAAGFFGVAMYYTGLDDAHPIPLCPVGVTPTHTVSELAAPGASRRGERRRTGRRLAGKLAYDTDLGTRTLVRGTVLSAALGVLSALPLVWRVLFPRAASRLHVPLPEVKTHLDLDFSVEEMARIVGELLEEIGLTEGFCELVLVVGHGSSSLNNPHESAHDCGACGGARGGPNARAFAQMANDARVRAQLAARGLEIPARTRFIGAFHDTCSDAISCFDLETPPPSFAELRDALDEARARDALERSRRFESARLDWSPAQALRHVEGRAVDLAQPRPEYGHATNATAVIGRRARTRGLFLDRRAFLVSYDGSRDPSGAVLARVLASVVPVGAGINLEYYFSYIDNVRYGAGTKLPHNITSLVGVMDGYSSDLRTGLPWQMVEIHEPVRLLAVVETRPELLLAAASVTPAVVRLVENGWIRLATLDPDSSALHVFRDGGFHPFEPEPIALGRASSSLEWFRGKRQPLEIAELGG